MRLDNVDWRLSEVMLKTVISPVDVSCARGIANSHTSADYPSPSRSTGGADFDLPFQAAFAK